MYKRVLLKISGEALSDNEELFSNTNIDNFAKEIAKANKEGVEICVVIGGGNLYRGKSGEKLGMDRTCGDYMGMLATCMNSLALANSLKKLDVPTTIMSSFQVGGLLEQFSQEKVMNKLAKKNVVIFAGGTGLPYFSTDTCSALRAIQCKCDIILAGKNGVDGVYSADPKIDKNAKKYDKISYEEVLEKNLQVMDLTAISLCKENKMKVFVYNVNKYENIFKAICGEIEGTLIY